MPTKTGTSWIPSTRTFGARLALVRWQMGWNVKEAAEACGLKESNWRGWELDGRMPQKLNDVAGAIAMATGANKYWLMDGEKQPDTQTLDYGSAPAPPATNVIDLTGRRRNRLRPGNRSDSTRPRGRAA